ncbi:DDB1- and CUL4-associated factor 11-like isoform X2 [Liolophura sinensis]|uniref:DDB1- and CUL4-associated factor 11-like isoform X2 n=1 Tax=Liolophura sinensis TaxID=3198878 RepID=UPI00315870D2
MGSSNSRRRRMNRDSDRRDDGEETDEGGSDTDLATILSYLIRSGQVQILQSDNLHDEDDDDDDDDCMMPRNTCPVPNFPPDISGLEKSEFKQAMLVQSGQGSHAGEKRKMCIPDMLHKRETGMVKGQTFSHSQRCRLNSPFLPNTKTTVASYHNKAFCGIYSQDGNVFLSACQDQNIRVYDTTLGYFRQTNLIQARDIGWSILDIAFSPDGHHLIYSSWSDNVHLCNLQGDCETHHALNFCPNDGRFCVFSLAFSENSTEILGGANDGCLYIYDTERNDRILKIDAHEDDVNAVAFADESSQILFSGGDDGLCKVWDRRTLSEEQPVPVGILAGHSDGITYIDSKGDARYLISNSKDQCIKLWDVRAFSPSEGQEATRRAVSSQRWDYRWQRVPRRVIRQKCLKGDTSLMTYRGHCVLHTLIRCHFSPAFSTAQRYIYSGCANGTVVIYDTLTGKILSKLEGHNHCVRDVSWHPYDNTIMSTSWDGTLGKWEYKTDAAFSDSDTDSDDGTGPRTKRDRRRRHNRDNQRLCRRPKRFSLLD